MGFSILRAYWFIFRPKTRGAKAILSYQGKILLVKPTYGYKYTFPGGGIKKKESPEEGLRREIKEELGIELGEVKFLGSFVSTAEYKKDEVFAFFSELKTDELIIQKFEIEKIKWVTLAEVEKLGPVSGRIVSLYLNG